MLGWPATSSGYRSMSFTTQSESVPLVDATKLAIGSPLIFTGAVSASEVNTSTSGRPDASRCSSTSQRDQLAPSIGRARYGTGFIGSETYSLKPKSLGLVKFNFKFEVRYNGVARTEQPLGHPAGHDESRFQVLVPVSNAVTGATSAFGAPSF